MRENTKLSGTTHNVFGIQVGVGITIAVRSKRHTDRKLFYHRVPEFATAVEKWEFLRHHVLEEGVKNALNTIKWTELTPNEKHTWLQGARDSDWDGLVSIGGRSEKTFADGRIFDVVGSAIITRRDDTVYNFSHDVLTTKMSNFIKLYNSEVERLKNSNLQNKFDVETIDDFVSNAIKWDSTLKMNLLRGLKIDFDSESITHAMYRPFTKQNLYFDKRTISRPGNFHVIFPHVKGKAENHVILFNGPASQKPFFAFVSGHIIDSGFVGGGTSAQCFPLYTYEPDGTRRDNITDWALQEFRTRSGIAELSKADIFYYVYAALHEPTWRADFALNLKKELPRIPWPDANIPVAEWVRIGRALAQMHLDYESGPRQALEWVETKQPVHFRVTKMKRVADSIVVNETLTLAGIPPVAWTYKLGNRSALEWLIDQYQVDGDSDPNAYSDDPMYIVNLVERVAYVSVQTCALTAQLSGISAP